MNRAWIIGGSEGIGLATAKHLLKDNWSVMISARNQDRLSDLQNSLGVQTLKLDATDPEQVKSAVSTVFSKDDMAPNLILINLGDYEPMPLEAYDYKLFERVAATNYLAPALLLGEILPALKNRGGGDVWVNASLAAYRGLPASAPYNASKAAVLSLVESVHLEARSWGINVGVINHGFVKTRLTDKNDFAMPLLMEPDEAASCIVKGMMNSKKFEISFPWQFTWWMKLLRCLPYSLYFYITRRLVT